MDRWIISQSANKGVANRGSPRNLSIRPLPPLVVVQQRFHGPGPNYEPNTLGGPKADAAYNEPPLKISGDADRYEQKRGVDDDYIQPGNLCRLMPPDEHQRLVENIAGSLGNVPKDLQEKMVAHFSKADPAYGNGVTDALGLT